MRNHDKDSSRKYVQSNTVKCPKCKPRAFDRFSRARDAGWGYDDAPPA